MSQIYVAPTELRHAPFRKLAKKGKGSGIPEERGVDFAFSMPSKVDGEKLWYGVQRKELKDFVASVNDGRLAKEVQQMCVLEQGVLIIEGQPRFDLEGNMLADRFGAEWNREKHIKQLLSVQMMGVWCLGTSDVENTAATIKHIQQWVEKGEHTSLMKRGGMITPWGTKTNEDYQRHLLMGLPGVDVVLGSRILAKLGMIFGLTVTYEDLLTVDGIGPAKARAICSALEGLIE